MSNVLRSLFSNASAETWKSGNIILTRKILKFPRASLLLHNISYLEHFEISWKEYVVPIFFVFLSLVSFFLIHITAGLIISFITYLIFPRYRHYLKIIANSGGVHLVPSSDKKFIISIYKNMIRFIESNDPNKVLTVNIDAETVVFGDQHNYSNIKGAA